MAGEVVLREARGEDVAVFLEHQRDRVAVRMAAFTVEDPDDRGAFEARWARLLDDPRVVARTIERDGEVVGHVARFERAGEAEVTYWVDRAAWGQGVATAALGLFLEEVTERPLHARAARENAGSLKVLERCGFVVCGSGSAFAHGRGEEVAEVVLRLG